MSVTVSRASSPAGAAFGPESSLVAVEPGLGGGVDVTVSVTVDGRNVNLPASNLTPTADGGATSSMSKAQISASTKPPA